MRAGAVAALGAALTLPAVRRRIGAHPALTTAAVASGPVALAVLRPRSKARDAALYALQMWAFTVAHELPYDDPEGLRRRLRIRYPIAIDRAIGRGELPSLRLQRRLGRPGRVTVLDCALSVVHWAWFLQPHLTLAYILRRHPEGFAMSARQMSAVYDLGCALYHAVPTAPPWWASEQGYVEPSLERVAESVNPVPGGRREQQVRRRRRREGLVAEAEAPEMRRIMVDVGERAWGRAWPRLYDSLGGNPWAAVPSLHFATSLMAALLLAEQSTAAGATGWAYALTLGFALVYLGEHYVTDLIAGAALVAVVRRGEPHVEPLARRVSAAVQRLERLAAVPPAASVSRD
ncbi:MAG TPA: phosphatase PAP2 family protein [Solirubrobacterales bacterium]|nr:phosphatase PAP2 family protein [Solirubrobacterales bacterium]